VRVSVLRFNRSRPVFPIPVSAQRAVLVTGTCYNRSGATNCQPNAASPTEQYMRNCKWIADHINEPVRGAWKRMDCGSITSMSLRRLGLDEVTRTAEQSARFARRYRL